MPRRNRPEKRIAEPDAKFNSKIIGKFINRLMKDGKKSIAESIFYKALTIVEDKTKKEGLEIFNQALKNVIPLVEVKARRIGGSTYQVPIEVRSDRGEALGSTWLIKHARQSNGKSMAEQLASEIMNASNNTGPSVKKREDTHKMAEANKAFAHYRF